MATENKLHKKYVLKISWYGVFSILAIIIVIGGFGLYQVSLFVIGEIDKIGSAELFFHYFTKEPLFYVWLFGFLGLFTIFPFFLYKGFTTNSKLEFYERSFRYGNDIKMQGELFYEDIVKIFYVNNTHYHNGLFVEDKMGNKVSINYMIPGSREFLYYLLDKLLHAEKINLEELINDKNRLKDIDFKY